jgi:hypothetical protein
MDVMASVRRKTAANAAMCILACFIASAAQAAPAQPDAKRQPAPSEGEEHTFWNRPESRTLATHVYIPPLLQQTAFVTTHFGVRQGVTVFVVPDVALDFGKDELSAAGFTQSFDLGVKLTDYLGLYGTLSGTVTSGINAASAFEIGADLEGAFELGAIVRLARLEPIGTQISLRLSGGMALENDLNVVQFVEAGGEATGDQLVSVRASDALSLLVTPSKASSFGGSLLLAQTLTTQLGLQASFSLRSLHTVARPFDLPKDRRVDETADELQVGGAVALSFDLNSWKVPIALMPEYQVLVQSVATEDDAGKNRELTYASHYAGLGLYYSGREHLVLGVGGVLALNLEQDRLEWNATNGTPRTSGTPTRRMGHFVLRYVW